MIVNVDSLSVTRFHSTIDCGLEILPMSISQDLLKFPDNPTALRVLVIPEKTTIKHKTRLRTLGLSLPHAIR